MYLGYVHLLQSPHEKLCSVRYRRKRKYISPHSHTRSTWKDHCGRERDFFSGWLHVYSTCTVRKIRLAPCILYSLHALLEKSGESLFPENPHKIVFLKKIIFFISTSTYSPFTLNMTKFVIQFTYAGISGSGWPCILYHLICFLYFVVSTLP